MHIDKDSMSLLSIETNDGKRTGFRPTVGHFNRLVKKRKKLSLMKIIVIFITFIIIYL